MIEIRLKPSALEHYQLPDILYPMSEECIGAALTADVELPFAEMLYLLQVRSEESKAEWLQLEPAMDRLVQLLVSDDSLPVVSAVGDNWWLEIGPVGLTGEIVTIQRQNHLIAAINPTPDGRLRVSAFHPLDGKSVRYLYGLALNPDPQWGVSMRANNWEYAKDASAGIGNDYAAARGEAYLSYWAKGIGHVMDGTIVPEWLSQAKLSGRVPARIATEVGVNYTFSEPE